MSRRTARSSAQRGFTLVELMVVVVIVGIMATTVTLAVSDYLVTGTLYAGQVLGGRAVVGGEEDHGFSTKAEPFDCIQNAAYRGIHVVDHFGETSIMPVRPRWRHRQKVVTDLVAKRHRIVSEERPVLVPGHEVNQKLGVDLGAVDVGLSPFLPDDSVAVDHGIVVSGAFVPAKHGAFVETKLRGMIRIILLKSQLPFARHCGRVAGLLEHMGEGGRSLRPRSPGRWTAKRILARHDCLTRRMTDRHAEAIRETRARISQRVNPARLV